MQVIFPFCLCCEIGSLLILSGIILVWNLKIFYRFFEAASPTNFSAATGFPCWQLTYGEFPIIAKCLCFAENSKRFSTKILSHRCIQVSCFCTLQQGLYHTCLLFACVCVLQQSFCHTDVFNFHTFILFNKGSTTRAFCLLVFVFFNKVSAIQMSSICTRLYSSARALPHMPSVCLCLCSSTKVLPYRCLQFAQVYTLQQRL